MTSLIFGTNKTVPPVEENDVRSTTEVIQVDAPPAESQGPPEWNERETDNRPHGGLVNRQVASDWHESERYAPSWATHADITESLASVNRQVSSSGTAATRELTGEQGHGTLAFAVGIEPVLREGNVYGADYFAVDERGVQDGIPDQMERAVNMDQDDINRIAGAAKVDARDATAAAYTSFYAAMTGRG